MTDYMSRDELSDEENIAQLALLAYCDPITFDDVMRSSKWRKAMDLEIEAIVMDIQDMLKENGEVDKYKVRREVSFLA
ncbi:unnamed protein product [Prunus armeniaca]|uniref:Uncharacterized protein n=1 Tax=Prunus armeniaca TaxID=36596 RepID=A0A6J5TVG2_PRUAR|nr:unnamed protein product [Prunus armeniaca]